MRIHCHALTYNHSNYKAFLLEGIVVIAINQANYKTFSLRTHCRYRNCSQHQLSRVFHNVLKLGGNCNVIRGIVR